MAVGENSEVRECDKEPRIQKNKSQDRQSFVIDDRTFWFFTREFALWDYSTLM